jgi:hypothetical protein
LKTHHPHLFHAKTEDDPDRRVNFCEIFRQKCAEDEPFPEKKMFGVTKDSLAESSFNNVFSSVQMDLGLPGLTKSLTEPVVSKRLIRLATVSRFIDW